MCLYCGCHIAHADHGNAANVSFEGVEAAAEANDMGVVESPEMMVRRCAGRQQRQRSAR